MKRLLSIAALFLSFSLGLSPLGVKAGSPAVVVIPPVIPQGASVTFEVIAANPSTVMFPITYTPPPPIPICSIAVVDPLGNVWQLWAGAGPATITLPDVGDRIELTYPVAGFAIVSDLDLDVSVTAGTLAWVWVGGPGTSIAPNTGVVGTYTFMFGGTETAFVLFYFDISSFFVISEFPVAMLGLTPFFVALLFKKHKTLRQ